MQRRELMAGLLLAVTAGVLPGSGGISGRGETPEPGARAAPGADALVAEGARWWTVSPDPGNPVACATCHHDSAATRGWAASFPKVKPLPPPHTRVMTLLQANAEAVERHYRLPDPRRAAVAITAYLTALGVDLPITPGASPSQPVFPERIRALAASVRGGRAVFAGRCGACHRGPDAASAARAFPRLLDGEGESLERFLERHEPIGEPLRWDGQATADLIAYLMSRIAGQPVGLYPPRTTKERP